MLAHLASPPPIAMKHGGLREQQVEISGDLNWMYVYIILYMYIFTYSIILYIYIYIK